MQRERPLVLVTGSRNWSDVELLARRLNRLPDDTTLIHGGARGVDTLAGEFARRKGFEVGVFPAPWKTEGRKAGFIRNEWMLDEQPNLVIAFATDIETSRGTRHCALGAHDRGYSLEIWQPGKPTLRFNMPPLYFPRLAD